MKVKQRAAQVNLLEQQLVWAPMGPPDAATTQPGTSALPHQVHSCGLERSRIHREAMLWDRRVYAAKSPSPLHCPVRCTPMQITDIIRVLSLP